MLRVYPFPSPLPPSLLAPADNNAGKGAAPAVGFFMVKYDGEAGARALRAETAMFRGLIPEFSRRERVMLLYSIVSSRQIALSREKYLHVNYRTALGSINR